MALDGGSIHLNKWWWVFNPSRPSDAYMRQWNGSLLVQVMACMLGAKPLPESKLYWFQWVSQQYIPMKFCLEIPLFSFKKMYFKIPSAKCQPFCSGLNIVKARRYWVTTPKLHQMCTMTVIQPIPIVYAQENWVINEEKENFAQKI